MTTNKRMVELDAVEKMIKKSRQHQYKKHGFQMGVGIDRDNLLFEILSLPTINPIDTTQVSRVEVIDEHGRAWTTYTAENVKIDFQDNERTLKIFLKSNKTPLQT